MTKMNLQNISALPVVLQDHLVVLPERWAMGDREQGNAQLSSSLHHQRLNLQRHQRGRLVKDCILEGNDERGLQLVRVLLAFGW